MLQPFKWQKTTLEKNLAVPQMFKYRVTFFLFYLFTLFVWLHWVLVAVCGIFDVAHGL